MVGAGKAGRQCEVQGGPPVWSCTLGCSPHTGVLLFRNVDRNVNKSPIAIISGCVG